MHHSSWHSVPTCPSFLPPNFPSWNVFINFACYTRGSQPQRTYGKQSSQLPVVWNSNNVNKYAISNMLWEVTKQDLAKFWEAAKHYFCQLSPLLQQTSQVWLTAGSCATTMYRGSQHPGQFRLFVGMLRRLTPANEPHEKEVTAPRGRIFPFPLQTIVSRRGVKIYGKFDLLKCFTAFHSVFQLFGNLFSK